MEQIKWGKKESAPERGDVLPCDCHHVFQDKRYGKGNRYHNPTRTNGRFRCTVCGKTK